MNMEDRSSFGPKIEELGIESGEFVGQKPHCLFISAAMGTNAGIEGIRKGFEDEYGGERNVDAFNSILNPKDSKNLERFDQMAEIIQKHAKTGLDIVVHSMGAAELQRAIKRVKRKDSTFFERPENTQNLHIILVSPSGFNPGFLRGLRYLGRTIKFNYEQGDWLKSKTFRRGIDALTAFPLEGIDPQELAQSLRKAVPELSQYREDITAISSENGIGYTSQLPEEYQKLVTEYSGWFQEALGNSNYDLVRRLTAEYGGRFHNQLKKVYAGEFETQREFPAIRTTVGGIIGMLNMMINSLVSVPMKELKDLEEKGVKIDFICPEYDMLMRVNEAIRFFGGSQEKASHIKMAEGRTHQFPGLEGARFGRIVKGI